MYRHTDVQTHRCTDTQMYRHTDVQTLRCTDTQMYRHTDVHVQTHRCTDTLMYRHTDEQNNIQTQKFTDLINFLLSYVIQLKYALEPML